MPKTVITPPGTGTPIAPFSPGTLADGVVYVSGTLAFDKDNRLGVAWDSKELRASGANLAVLAAISADGLSFSTPAPIAEAPAAMMPAMFTCGRTAGWCAHILEQKRLGKLVRPAAIYTGPAPRTPESVEGWGQILHPNR